MDKDTLLRLEKLNQLRLTEEEREKVLAFFDAHEQSMEQLRAIDTEKVLRMVHVMPLENVLREDIASQPFSREALQEGAPETYDGYWLVPRVVE